MARDTELEIKNKGCRYINYRRGKRIDKRRETILRSIICFRTNMWKL